MWNYYGSKSKFVKKYPKPTHHKIIEPFAGTARYALEHWEHDVLLIDKFKIVTDLWKWLQTCSKKDILGIRQLKYGESTDDFTWDCLEQKHLIGYLIGGGSARPRKKATKWRTIDRPEAQIKSLKIIAGNLHKIKHWEIHEGSYTTVPNIKATWFIDPPYVLSGTQYTCGSKNINYGELANWCMCRYGQSIVCEAQGATWLPFNFFSDARGLNYHKEVMWTNENKYKKELTCPKCGADMKEFVTRWRCRNLKCRYEMKR